MGFWKLNKCCGKRMWVVQMVQSWTTPNESNEIKQIISECNILIALTKVPWKACCILLHSVPRGVQFTRFFSELVCQHCELGIVEFSFSAGKSFSQSSHSASRSSVSVLYQRTPFPAVAPWHVADSSFYRSPERTQLQCTLPVTCKNINTYCTVRSVHTWLWKVYYGAMMKVIIERCHETNKTSMGHKERYCGNYTQSKTEWQWSD